jgi:hypothetical protein
MPKLSKFNQMPSPVFIFFLTIIHLYQRGNYVFSISTPNYGEIPLNVKVALYHDPQTMVAAQNAYFVVGSKAKGTMTKTSKLAFGSQQEAEGFAGTCGGEVMGFQKTFELAKQGHKK